MTEDDILNVSEAEDISSDATHITDLKTALYKKENPLISLKYMVQEAPVVVVPTDNTSGSESITVAIPKAYSSVKSPCVFKFDRGDKSAMLVTVAGYSKNIVGIAPSVNVADYFRYKFKFWPIVSGEFSIVPALSMQRLVEASIGFVVGTIGHHTACVELSSALSDITEMKGLLSDIRIRHIGKGQFDEFTVIADRHTTLSIKDKYQDNLLAGDVEMKQGMFFSTDDRFKLTLTTSVEDCDALAVHIKLRLGDDLTSKQVLFNTAVTGGCNLFIKDSHLYMANNLSDTSTPVDLELVPGASLDLWLCITNTNSEDKVGTYFIAALRVEDADAGITSESLKVDGLYIGGWKFGNMVAFPFLGKIDFVEVCRVDDDFEKLYILLVSVVNPGIDNDVLDGIETIWEEKLIARYSTENLKISEKIWHDSTQNGLDLQLIGEISIADSKQISPGMQVIGIPVKESCRVIVKDENTGRTQEINYICHENVSGVRLAWLNRYGAIDQYNFEIISEQATELEKTSIYTDEGYLTTDISADDYTTVTTRALPASQLKSMTDVLISDHVFLIENEGIVEVDVVSDEAITLNNDTMKNLSIRFRPKKRRL